MRILHGYILRELLKTFAMTAVALTLLVVMGGGVANIFKADAIGAKELGQVFIFMAPVAVTMILPVAALFSVAITYGRFAADNEVTACRAAGINVQRLLLPALMLGLLVTGVTYYAWNYFIPSLSERLTNLTRRDLPAIVVGQLQREKAVSFGKYRLSAEGFRIVPPEELPPDLREQHAYVMLLGVSFLELVGDDPARLGTADSTYIDFDRGERNPTVTVLLQGVRSYDLGRRQYLKLEEQQLGPYEIPFSLKRKLKFADVATLRAYRDDATQIPEVSDLLFQLRRELWEHFVFREFDAAFNSERGGRYQLVTPGGSPIVIEYQKIRLGADERETELGDVTVRMVVDGEPQVATARAAAVRLKTNLADRENPSLLVEVKEVSRQIGESAAGDARVVTAVRETLPEMRVRDQPGVLRHAESFDFGAAMDPAVDMAWMTSKLKRVRERLLKRKAELSSEVRGEIHFRASYAATAVATILLGAMFGIILRGGQVLTAFGISCVPTAFVVVAAIVGRNLAGHPQFGMASLSVMWGAAAVLYAAAAVVATRWLPR